MEAQALLIYKLAVKHYPADSIVLYGKSMGTGVAAWLAAQVPCRQLILETPYYSIPSLAHHYFPVYPAVLLSRYTFPVHDYLNQIHCPVTLIHGTADAIIPFEQSRKLASENSNNHLLYIGKGGHNNLISFPVFQQYIDSLLSN